MNTSSNLFVSTAKAYKCHLAIAILALASFAPLANAIPSNRERYDCYRKSDNQFSFGSSNNVSNSTTLCTLNPNYRSRTGVSQRRRTATRSRTSKKVYNNYYRNRRDNTGEKVAIGLGSFVFGAFVGNAIWGWGWGWGGGGWGGWGDTFIDNSINVDIGDIGDLDASIQDLDLTDIDASGDDFSGDDFGDDFSGDDFGDDFSGDDFGGNDMGDDFGGDDFGGNDMGDDFGGDDFGDFGGDDFGGDDFGGDDFGGDDFGDF